MPLRSAWSSPYEGFTFDTVLSLLNSTLFNSWISLPLYAFSLYTQRGRDLVAARPSLASLLKTCATLSALKKLNAYLDMGITNNWSNDVFDWSKEVVLVTGGSDGIGAIVVQLLAEKGIKIVILDVQPPKFLAPSNVLYVHCDLASPSSIREIATGIIQKVGNPTVLVLNAGITRGNKSILQTTEQDLKLTFEINTLSHYHLVQTFLPHMVAKNHGMVVSVASTAGYVTAPEMVSYAASKAAAVSFYEGLQAELATTYQAPKVRTVLVTQGFTKTKLFTGFHPGDGFINYALDPRTVADEIVRAIFRGRSDHVLLPRGTSYITLLRSWPLWMQAHVRKDLRKMMKGFSGRMIEQPSEVPGLPGANTSVAATTVLTGEGGASGTGAGSGVSPVTPKSLEGSAVIV